MAHAISNVGFGDEVFTAGKPAWHGLGQNVRECVTSAEAMHLAGLDWHVFEAPVYGLTTVNANKSWEPSDMTFIGDKKMTFRVNSEGKPVYLGTVGQDWHPVQNTEAFDFMDGLVGEGRALYETAGALRQGKRVWMLCRIPGDLIVTEGDNIRRYLLLANGHDGGMALRIFFTPVRVVCANTLAMAMSGGASSGVTLRHTGGIMDRLQEARGVLGLAVKHYETLGESFNRFFKEAMTTTAAKDYFREVLPNPKDKEESARAENSRDAMLEGFKRGRGARIAGPTLWGAYNAVTEFSTHTRFETKSRTGRTDSAEKRFESVMLGTSRKLTERAFEVAAGMVGIGN